MSAEALALPPRGSRAVARLIANRITWFALAVIAVLLFAGLFLPALMGNPGFNTISRAILQPPSADYWLGTDELGRSVLVQMIYGVRTSLVVGLLAALSATLAGVVVGALSGFVGGRVDAALMRVTEMFQASCRPSSSPRSSWPLPAPAWRTSFSSSPRWPGRRRRG